MQRIHWARLDRFLFAGPSSLVPNHRSMKDKSVCSVVAGDLYGPCRQLQINHSPKKHKLGDFFFTNLFFSPNQKFPPTKKKKSKLLKDWVHSCFDFWYIALLKRDLATSPSDSTQCQGLSLRKTQWKKGLKKKTEHEFITCYEIVSIFNFQFILNFKHWIQCDELFSQRQQKVSNPTFSYFMYSNHLQTS